jgi:hypothetical protein
VRIARETQKLRGTSFALPTRMLDEILPTPRLLQTDSVDLDLPIDRAWERIRHGELASSPIVRALFWLRTVGGDDPEPMRLHLKDMVSTPERPGFQILCERFQEEVVVGAIGKVWHLDIPFVHSRSVAEYRAFDREGFIKVAWALKVTPIDTNHTRVTVEVRVDATDRVSWNKFRAYWLLIGPASHFIRRILLSQLVKDAKETLVLAGDELLPEATDQVTQWIDIDATPEAIWPWLVQMGCHRAGYYSIDFLDNGGERSAREIHPDLQDIRVGQVLPATPESSEGFEVLRIEGPNALVLGGLFSPDEGKQLPFASTRPSKYWQVTWSFTLVPHGKGTRLYVRARAAFSKEQRLHATWIRFVHRLMESSQLRHLAARAEGTQPVDDWRDVADGIGGALLMGLGMATPFLRPLRNHWGLDQKTAARAYPGDDLVSDPTWGWTHAIEIAASGAIVWPWVAQIGADRGGFYSYQWLENIAGCQLRNAEAVHPEWRLSKGDGLLLHPKMPPLEIVEMREGSYFIAHGRADKSKPTWVEATWLFLVEPMGESTCRVISRYRVHMSSDLSTRIAFGPMLVEPIGFAMDRRMLIGIKERVERRPDREPRALLGSPAP